jgi:hypothetical protein
MRWPWQPKNTFESGLQQILEGLENGSIVLGHTNIDANVSAIDSQNNLKNGAIAPVPTKEGTLPPGPAPADPAAG